MDTIISIVLIPGLQPGLSLPSILGSAECDGDAIAIQRSRKVIDTNVPDWPLRAVVTREPWDARRFELDRESPFAQRIDFEIIVAVNRKNSLPLCDPLYTPVPVNRAAFAPGGYARPPRRAGTTPESLSYPYTIFKCHLQEPTRLSIWRRTEYVAEVRRIAPPSDQDRRLRRHE